MLDWLPQPSTTWVLCPAWFGHVEQDCAPTSASRPPLFSVDRPVVWQATSELQVRVVAEHLNAIWARVVAVQWIGNTSFTSPCTHAFEANEIEAEMRAALKRIAGGRQSALEAPCAIP